MKKRFTAAVLAVLMAFSCTACASQTDSESGKSQGFTTRLDTSEEVTLNIIGNMGNFEALEAVITDFEGYYPNCDVLYSPVTDVGYWTVIESRLQSDDTVGIFMMNSETYSRGESMQNLCMNLLDADIDLSAIQDEVISSSTVDGKLYQIPIAHNAAGLIVNKTLLENAELEIPTNYSEFLNACEILKNAGYVPLQGQTYSVSNDLMRSMSFVLMNNEFNNESDSKLEDIKAGKEGSATLLQPVFDILSEMCSKGYIDTEVNGKYEDNYNDAILRFFEGDVPFLVGTTETLSGMKKRESKSAHFTSDPFEYVFMPAPFAEDGAYCYLENWYGFSISENCTNKEWAVEFLRFLATNEEINKLAYVKGLPSVAKETDDERFIGLYSERDGLRCTVDTFFPQNVQDALYYAEDDLISGKITATEAVSEMERRIRENDFSE